LSGIGPFGGLYEFKGYREPVLVSSVDGVGTKTRIANVLDKHYTIGVDIVNHCVNDILTCKSRAVWRKPAGKLIAPSSVVRLPKCPGYTTAAIMTWWVSSSAS
jgi:hypothetical protein